VTRDCTLEEMVAKMLGWADGETFRFYQTSYVAEDGSTHPLECLRVTIGDIRRVLAIAFPPVPDAVSPELTGA